MYVCNATQSDMIWHDLRYPKLTHLYMLISNKKRVKHYHSSTEQFIKHLGILVFY